MDGFFKEGRYIPLPNLSEDQSQYLAENNKIIIRLINEKFAAAIEDIRKEVIGSVKDHINDLVTQAVNDENMRNFQNQIKTLRSIYGNDELQRMLPMERLRYAAFRHPDAPIKGVWDAVINGVLADGYEVDIVVERPIARNPTAQSSGDIREEHAPIVQTQAAQSNDYTGERIAQAQRTIYAAHAGNKAVVEQSGSINQAGKFTKLQLQAGYNSRGSREAQALLGDSEQGRGIIKVLSAQENEAFPAVIRSWKKFKRLYDLVPGSNLSEICHRVNDEFLDRLKQMNPSKKNFGACKLQNVDFANAATHLQAWLKKGSKPSYAPNVPTPDFLQKWKLGYHSCGLLHHEPRSMHLNVLLGPEKSVSSFSNGEKRALPADFSTEEHTPSKKRHKSIKQEKI